VIGAGGVEIGGAENYVAAYRGVEGTLDREGAHVDHITLGEIGLALEIPLVAGAGPLGGGFRQDSGEWGVFFGAHGGVLGAHAGLGFGVTFGPSVNALLDRLIGLTPTSRGPQ